MKEIVLQLKHSFWASLFLVAFACQASHVNGPQDQKIFQPPIKREQQENFLGPQSKQAKGEHRVILLAVRFPDVKPSFSLDHIKKRAVTRLNDYVKIQSYGQAWIKPHFIGWVSLPDPISQYRVSPDNFEVDRGKVRKLIEDTMTAVEKKVDFSHYDHMLIIPGAFTLPGKGYGMACYCANPGMLTGVRGFPRNVTLRSKGGQEFSGGMSVGVENAHLGMFAHDLFHAFGGVHAGKRLVP
jgi:hypothetical protein